MVDIQDIIKEKDRAYTERNMLVSCLLKGMAMFPKFKVFRAIHPEDDDKWDKEWRTIVGVEYHSDLRGFTQASWHFHDNEFYLVKDLPFNEEYKWDGHTTQEKYTILLEDFNCMYLHKTMMDKKDD